MFELEQPELSCPPNSFLLIPLLQVRKTEAQGAVQEQPVTGPLLCHSQFRNAESKRRDLSSNSSSASNFMCDPGIRYLTILGLSFLIHEMGMTSALLQRDVGMLLDRKAC